jgi:exonuclease SbcC
MSIRFLHVADIHFDAANQEAALASLATLAEAAEREDPSFVVLAGDLWNRGVQNSEAAGFPALLAVIRRILEVCPIYAVSGTPTHDLPGAYKVLEEIAAVNTFTVVGPSFYCQERGYLILGCPEPTKEWLLAGAPADIDANQAVKDGMRRILLGLGALRAEHPDLFCVFLYHGAVAGASMCNGQLVDGGISIGREDLALVGADYYALGHIHLAQQIGDLPAYYSGSAYPCDWGETDQKGFNLVTIDPTIIDAGPISDRAIVTRLPFPHPPRAKFVLDWPEPVEGKAEGPTPIADQIKGIQAWIVHRASKEQAQKIDKDALLKVYLLLGALPGSRVTVETIPTETVRAAEITEKHALEDKLVIYAEASGDPEPHNSLREKAHQLERDAAASGAAPEGLHIRLRKLRLRGAIGIWKGQHVDETELDLDRYDAGLIALVGANGAGKTTLIENMHPYPQMLTRDGSLQAHFRLRGSLRELTFVDERTGTEYRALIQIDGQNASGSCEYHLFANGEPLTNGRKADYEEKIGRLFGSLPLFLRSAFVSQRATKNNPDLSEATKGEKKSIFRELAGLDYLQAYAENAKAKGNILEGEISMEATRVNLLESQLTALPGIRADLDTKGAALLAAVGQLEETTARVETAKGETAALAEKISEQKSLAERIAGLEDQLAQKHQTITIAQEGIQSYQQALDQKSLAEKVIATWDNLKEQENAENGRLATVNADHARLQGEYNTRLKAHHDDVRKIEGKQSGLRTENARLAGDRKVLQTQVDHLAGDLKTPLKENCPTCGQLLPETKLAELKQKRTESETKLAELKQKHAIMERQIETIDQQLAAITFPLAIPPLVLPPVDQAALRLIQSAIAVLNIVEARKTLATAQEAATRIEEAGKRQREAEQAIGRIEGELGSAQGKVDPKVQPAYEEAQEKLEAARGEYGEAQKAIATLEAQIAAFKDRIAELERQAADLEARREKIAAAKTDLAEWRYLERACGPDGIQALELDAMGPGIAEVANRLLSAAYGSRFALEFRTTRIAGKGSKTRQIEDFSIWILDSEDGSEQELSTLSGGEAVWIKRAIYDAFGIVRERSTGTKFLTVFADEADGALDPEARARYVQMMQQAHAESGRRHTIIITHSETAQEMIGQRIVMSELVGVKT